MAHPHTPRATRMLARRALLAAPLLLTGCYPDLSEVEITTVTNPPLPVTVTPQQIEMPEGIAVAVDVVGYDTEGDEVDQLNAHAAYSGIFGIEKNETEARWIIYGSTPGSDELVFTTSPADGEVRIPVTITSQP